MRHTECEGRAGRWGMGLLCAALAAPALPALHGAEPMDAYLRYVRTAPEFRRVRQDPELLVGRWDTWVYMPWRYKWHIGTGEEGGRFCREYGFNGGFVDHGRGPFAWLEKWGLRFYNDHTASKGYLYLHRKKSWRAEQLDARALRTSARGDRPLDRETVEKLKSIVSEYVARCVSSPMRVAYALDDEISWGSFVVPLPWRLHDDDADYARWLELYYGAGAAPEPRYVTPEFTRAQLGRQLKDIDFSPLLDRVSYNDSYWANVLGELVEAANAADPVTPCGFVGGQAPNMWGGYDYAKLMKKVQFVEAYNLGSSQAIIRSFNPANALAQVTTHFHSDKRGTVNDIWQTWYYFAHGNRGMIGWVDGWFEGKQPRAWLDEYKATNIEVTRVQGPKLVGARWIHDGVGIYYSHPSIQVSWCLDSQAHGSTWVNRNNDHRLGTSHMVRKAWEYLLTDSGIQYSFVPYDEVVVGGVSREYKVLILPACYALSDIEARRITAFCEAGGTVIADFACGLFDQHGRGRVRGALDGLFGMEHDGTARQGDLFGGRLWVETDQDKGYYYKTHRERLSSVSCTLEHEYARAENRLPTGTVRRVGAGRAVYLNLSPQRYLMYREEGTAGAARRDVFVRHVLGGGVRPWVTVTGEAGERPRNCEVTYWAKEGRTLCFLVQNAVVTGSPTGGGGVEGLSRGETKVTVAFPRLVSEIVDERTGAAVGSGASFALPYRETEAAFFSFGGSPPRP